MSKHIDVSQSSLNVHAKEFTPRTNATESVVPSIGTVCVMECVQLLSCNPAEFEEEIHTVVATLNQYPMTEPILKEIVDIIVDQSISDENFRYNGARMCHSLQSVQCKELKFLDVLLRRCQKDHITNITDGETEQSIKTIHGYTLFLAELFIHLRIHGKPLDLLMGPIHKQLIYLYENSNTDNIRCIIRVLKLAGRLLEDTEISVSPSRCCPRMDGIFDGLKSRIASKEIARNIKVMLLSLVELRARSWDYEPEDDQQNLAQQPTASNGAVAFGDGGPNVPAYYNEMGQPLSEEDCYLIQTQWIQESNDASKYPASEFPNVAMSEMGNNNYAAQDSFDEEIADAYEQFLEESNLL